MGILDLGVSGIRSNETQACGMPILFLVEKGMPNEFKEILERTAFGVKIFVWEVSLDDPMVTGNWDKPSKS